MTIWIWAQIIQILRVCLEGHVISFVTHLGTIGKHLMSKDPFAHLVLLESPQSISRNALRWFHSV